MTFFENAGNPPVTNDSQIDALRAMLAKMITGWRPNGSTPPNFERKTGMGAAVATVDVRCGGYGWAHWPQVIGWRVQLPGSSSYDSGLIFVDYSDLEGGVKSKDSEAKVRIAAVAIALAKASADKALNELKGKP